MKRKQQVHMHYSHIVTIKWFYHFHQHLKIVPARFGQLFFKFPEFEKVSHCMWQWLQYPLYFTRICNSLYIVTRLFTVMSIASLASMTTFSLKSGLDQWIRSGSDPLLKINGFAFTRGTPWWIRPWAKDLHTANYIYLKPWKYCHAETMMI